ncbi:response regulator transcription factor [Kribbella sp. NPDC023972]|uniref:response regulator n=1 Tax=Kribbella sp. NPDC023972 TaxID=3154795 RepID=UPI0033CA1CFC
MALRCFIVDDSTHFLEAAQTLLERDGVSVVGVASTIGQALREVADAEPDVVLVDVDLGDESGFDLARRLQRETSLDRTKVILISTHAEEDVAELVGSAPVAAYLSKSELSAAAIRRILDATLEG